MRMTKEDLQRVMVSNPQLNDFGIGVYDSRRKTREQRDSELAAGREDLANSLDACNRVCEWLANVAKIRTINEARGSYGLKHIAENDLGYITNGVFIAAAIHAGFPYRVVAGNPNATFGMSERSIKQIVLRQRASRKPETAVVP